MADTSIKLSGTYDSIEAYRILEEMRGMSEDYEDIKEEAEAASSAATAASTAATNAVNAANTAVSNAQTYADNANTYSSNAASSATNAASSATNASNSASAAAASEINASASESAAAASASEAAATVSDVSAAISAINTRLGTVLSASGEFSTVKTITTACQITEHAAGTWLIIGYATLSLGGDGIYNTYIYAAERNLRYTRNACNSGGGNVNVVIATLAKNEPVILKGYIPADVGNFRGSLQMVQLA